MILKNPTKDELSIQYEGVRYTIPALGELSLPAAAAEYWQTMIHNFLTMSPEKSKVEFVAPVAPVAPVTPVEVQDPTPATKVETKTK